MCFIYDVFYRHTALRTPNTFSDSFMPLINKNQGKVLQRLFLCIDLINWLIQPLPDQRVISMARYFRDTFALCVQRCADVFSI